MKRLTRAQLIAKLDAIPGGDPEASHCVAENVLLDHIHPEVKAAYLRVIERENGRWWFA